MTKVVQTGTTQGGTKVLQRWHRGITKVVQQVLHMWCMFTTKVVQRYYYEGTTTGTYKGNTRGLQM